MTVIQMLIMIIMITWMVAHELWLQLLQSAHQMSKMFPRTDDNDDDDDDDGESPVVMMKTTMRMKIMTWGG